MQGPPIPTLGGYSLPTNPAVLNSSGKLTNCTGTLLDFTFAGQALMPTTSPDGSAFFKVTNTTGAPTNLAAPSGALAFDNVGSQLYYFNGASWVAVGAAGASPWSTVLAAGNTSGANDAVMSAGQQLRFVNGIRVGGNGVNAGLAAAGGVAVGGAATATGATSIAIGDSTNATGNNAVAIGFSAASTFANSVAIGAGVATTAPNQIALGQAAATVIVAGKLAMPIGAVVGTTSLLNVTSVPGTPTSAGVAAGSLALDDTNKLLYVYTTASGWQTVGASTPSLSAVLAVGNTSGANNIVISAGQQLTFAATSGVKIGLNGATTGTTDAAGISIGNASTSASGTSSVAIGIAATASAADSIAIGTQGTVAGSQCVKIGKGTIGSGSQNVAVGDTLSITGTSTRCVLLGQGFTIPAVCNDTIVIGYQPTITGTPSNSLCIGTSNVLGFANVCAVGNGAAGGAAGTTSIGTNANNGASAAGTAVGNAANVGSGAGNTAIGSSALCGASTNGVVVGASSALTGSTTGCIAIGNTTSVTAGSNSIAIGASVTVGGSTVVKIGTGASGSGASNVGIGGTVAFTGTAATSVAIGGTLTIPTAASNVIAVGYLQTIGATCTGSVVIGATAKVANTNQVAIGLSADAGSSNGGVAVGSGATIGAALTNSVAIGLSAQITTAGNTTVVGAGSTSASNQCAVFGAANAVGSGSGNSIIVGRGSTVPAAATDNIIIGTGSSLSTAAARVILLGNALTISPAADSMYTTTTWAASAAGTTISYDASGRIHPNTSSIRYKQDLQPLKEPQRVLQIQPYNYAFKPGYCGCEMRNCDGICCGKREVGAVAEEVVKILPEIVTFSLDPETKHPRPESIMYERMTVYLLEVIKNQQSRLDILEEAISKLLK